MYDGNCRHTGSALDIVQRKISDSGVELEQKRQRLTNATSSAEDGDLGVLFRSRSVRSSVDGHKELLLRTSLAVVEKARRPRMLDAERAAYIVSRSKEVQLICEGTIKWCMDGTEGRCMEIETFSRWYDVEQLSDGVWSGVLELQCWADGGQAAPADRVLGASGAEGEGKQWGSMLSAIVRGPRPGVTCADSASPMFAFCTFGISTTPRSRADASAGSGPHVDYFLNTEGARW